MDAPGVIQSILDRFGWNRSELAKRLGTSLVNVARWQSGDLLPDLVSQSRLTALLERRDSGASAPPPAVEFPSHGATRRSKSYPLFDNSATFSFESEVRHRLVDRIRDGEFWGEGRQLLADVLADHGSPAHTPKESYGELISAGKNTYTYDAHTYHTKVPPQGIAQLIRQYLPEGGVILDPFAGSGMTGVAARVVGVDVILNELSPAASFIASQFVDPCCPLQFEAAAKELMNRLGDLRKQLYSTSCRECGNQTEVLYTVWSYRVICSKCEHEFLLWDHCRKYGKTVRDHKILKHFPCPRCQTMLAKSRLARTVSQPVLIGYRCCSRKQVEHPLTSEDFDRLEKLMLSCRPLEQFTPSHDLPDGVNLRQPKRHGLSKVSDFYTPRNLVAMSHLWREICRISDDSLAGHIAFAFTSLYQRVTRLSEFRFWGGSGNTANYNVPFVSNEANVFVTFSRKVRAIQDHLETTARVYTGRAIVRTGSATDMKFLPPESIDLIFTDPPFGANINYSEMNFLWESWLEEFTDPTCEAIVNRSQGKDVTQYQDLMAAALQECHRVLRRGHWLILMFMNSSESVWSALRDAITAAGFRIARIDIFDKQHGTFKQFVSENTAGCDLLIHCKKDLETNVAFKDGLHEDKVCAVLSFLRDQAAEGFPMLRYLHVERDDELDYRMLYSKYIAESRLQATVIDFATFREVVDKFMKNEMQG